MESRFGARPRDIRAVCAFARAHRLRVVESHRARRSVVLHGTCAAFNAAFHIELLTYRSPQGAYRGYAGPLRVPAKLAAILQSICGLDTRPQAQRPRPLEVKTPKRKPAYTPPRLARLYGFPQRFDGRGQCVGVIELGGGYRRQDLVAYFKWLKLPRPDISFVCVDGVRNKPLGRTRALDGEVVGDIETIGGIAPGARMVVYFAPNSDRGFLDAVAHAVHDRKNKPSILSISWGDSEFTWSPQTMRRFNETLQEAAALGITVLCSAGDQGSTNGEPGGAQHVNFPASSPYATGCGGTSIVVRHDRIVRETVWSDSFGTTGGGVSAEFPVPAWQKSARIPPSANRAHQRGRGVPDVAGNTEGYSTIINGKHGAGGGTSAVAPLWAGLIARINQMLGRRVGFLNPFLYGEYSRLVKAGAFREITHGRNGAYRARKGWNPCTGLGVPDGAKLAAALGPAFRRRT